MAVLFFAVDLCSLSGPLGEGASLSGSHTRIYSQEKYSRPDKPRRPD